MNMKRHLLVAVAVLAMAAFSSVSLAQRGPGPRSADPEQRIERMAERLGLSETQKEEFAQVMEQRRSSIEPGQLRQAQQALAQSIEAEVFDENAIRAAAATVAEIEADRAVARARVASELRAILTPEQYEKFSRMKDRMAHRRGDRSGRSGRRHRGPRPGQENGE